MVWFLLMVFIILVRSVMIVNTVSKIVKVWRSHCWGVLLLLLLLLCCCVVVVVVAMVFALLYTVDT
jgi:hypothetical protein